jgi:hypothetical protein
MNFTGLKTYCVLKILVLYSPEMVSIKAEIYSTTVLGEDRLDKLEIQASTSPIGKRA